MQSLHVLIIYNNKLALYLILEIEKAAEGAYRNTPVQFRSAVFPYFNCLNKHIENVNYIIFDLEATCWPDSPRALQQEIIEIGAYRINDYAEVEGVFNRFVRPYLNPFLSPYCTNLTSISQADVNRASYFKEVIEEFLDWSGIWDDEEYMLCSWGNYDKKQLIIDCKLHDIEYDWVENHINLKRQYQVIKKLNKACGLSKAVKREGFEFEGTLHRGIDDAKNLAKIFAKNLDEWTIF